MISIDMAENVPSSIHDGDADSGVVSAQPPISPNGSPTQPESSPIGSSQLVPANGQLNGVLVFNEPERPNYSDDNEVTTGVPVLEIQRPPSPNQNGAHFSIGPLFPAASQEESGDSQQSSGLLLLQEAQKVIGKETREQKAKLVSTEAKLKRTESQLQETKEKLANAEAKTVEVERKLSEMTKKKDEAEQKLAEVEAKRDEELQQYNSELSLYRDRLAHLEQKNETQRTEYEKKIKKLKAEMKEKTQSYDKHVLELTKEKCDLTVQVANMKTEEQSLKRQIAELQRDMERQARVNVCEKFDKYKSNSESELAKKDAEIQRLQRLVSKASIDSTDSSQEMEKYSFKFSKKN